MRARAAVATGVAVLVPMVLVAACGGGGGGGGGGSASPAPCIVGALTSFPAGSVPPGFNTPATVQVFDSSCNTPLSNALVTLNAVNLTYNAAYQGWEGNVLVNPGGSVSLSVNVGGTTYSASGTQFTSYPTIAAPATGATWSSLLPNTVGWSGGAPAADSAYALGVLDAADPNGQLLWPQGYIDVESIYTTALSIPPNALTAGNRLVIAGIVTVRDIPNAALGSGLLIGGFNYVPITVVDRINTATLLSIAVTPSSQQVLAKGTTRQFTATGAYSDNSTLDLTTQVTWTSSNTAVASINATGEATGVGVGETSISATLGNVSDSGAARVISGFMPAVNYPGASESLSNTAIGDLNGDGRKDVAALEWPANSTRILIYYQNSGGTLDAPQVITTDLIFRGIAIADVNNDGLADLVVSGISATATSGFLGRVTVYKQDGATHTLGAPQEYVLSTNEVFPFLAVADLNGDGLPDVVSAGWGGGNSGSKDVISILFQGAGGTLLPEVTYTNLPLSFGGELHVGDMNNDGLNDIVTAIPSDDLRCTLLAVIKQTAPGSFSSTPDSYPVQTNFCSFNIFALGDLNDDGLVDVAVADSANSGRMNIFLQNANGILAGPTLLPIAYTGQGEVVIADLDGDGLNDIISWGGDNAVRVLYQHADHSFQDFVTYYLPMGGNTGSILHHALSVGDVTGDGLPDIVLSWGNAIFVLPGSP